MQLRNHYNGLWEDSLLKFRAGAFELDPFLNSDLDNRFGITLLFRPSKEVVASIEAFLQELRQIEPEQYYYPASDMHVTVMSIISCHTGLKINNIEVGNYVAVLQESLAETGKFMVDFTGITASPSCIMVQGFPATAQLKELRNRLRENFGKTALQQSIDSRYVLQTAHSTVARFKNPLINAPAFLRKVQEYRTHPFGSTEVAQVELVYNDWYQRKALVQQLATFSLK